MSLARAISRGRALKARLAVNGMKKASRSFGADAATEEGRACAMNCCPVRVEGRKAGVAARYQGMGPAGIRRHRRNAVDISQKIEFYRKHNLGEYMSDVGLNK